jgi:hypothetical protein
MPTITIYFVGICTHVRLSETDHRVILINGSKPDEINEHRIEPHEAWLRYFDADDGKEQGLPLDGVLITINGIDRVANYDESWETCMPKLGSYVVGPLQLSDEIVNGMNPERVAARFTSGGDYVAGSDENGATLARLRVETEDPPQLTLTGFAGWTRIIPLEDGANVQIDNLGSKLGDDQDSDFLLHFKIADGIPSDASWPNAPLHCVHLEPPFRHNTVGPGCANSSYP